MLFKMNFMFLIEHTIIDKIINYFTYVIRELKLCYYIS